VYDPIVWQCSLAAVVAIGCGRVGFDAPRLVGDDSDIAMCGARGLVAHYPLDDTSGSTIVDASGSHDGRWSDSDDDVADASTPGRRGGALSFDTGISMAVPGFVIPMEGTFAVWLTSTFDDTSTPSQHPMVLDAPTRRTTISFAGNIASYGLRTNEVSWQATYMPANDITGWFHLTATWSSNGAQLYIDGVPRGIAGTADARSTSDPDMYIGTREELDRWWFGLMDDIRVYDYPMTAADVAELYGCP
jgi:hypothetical protein